MSQIWYTIRDMTKPVIFDKIHTAFTYLNKDTELFKIVNVEMTDTLEEYVTLASETEQAQKDYFTAPLGNDVFQFSAFPWAAYTHISHTDSGNKNNATPLFDWGRYEKRNGMRTIRFVRPIPVKYFIDISFMKNN